MTKDKYMEEFRVSYDRQVDELIINYDGSLRDAAVYCEPLVVNGMKITDIQLKRDTEGRVASIRIRNYIDNMDDPRLEEILGQICSDFPILFLPTPKKKS